MRFAALSKITCLLLTLLYIATPVSAQSAPSGTLTTNSPCSLPGPEAPNRCMVTMNITKQNILIGCTWFLNPTQLIGCDGNSPVTGTTGWVTTTPRIIELRGHPGYPVNTEAGRLAGAFLDQKTVVAAAPSGTLGTNSPCSLPGPTDPNRCTITMNITKQNVPIGCTWFLNPTKLISCNGNSPVTATTEWITATPRVIELRGHPNYPTSTEASRLAGVFLDQKTVVAVRASSSSSIISSSSSSRASSISSTPSSANSSASSQSIQSSIIHFTYDELGRLKTVTHPNNLKNSYDYDSAGNRINKKLTID